MKNQEFVLNFKNLILVFQKKDIRSIKEKEIKHLEEKQKNLKKEEMPEKCQTLERNAESQIKNANSLKSKILEMPENEVEELNLETECKLAGLHETDKNKQTNLTGLDNPKVQESSSLQPLFPDFSVSVLRFQDAIESFSQAVFNDAFDLLGNIQSTESEITNVKKSPSKSTDFSEDKNKITTPNKKSTKEEPLLNTKVSNKLTELKGNSSSVIEPEMLEVVEEPIMAEVAYTVGTKQKHAASKIKDVKSVDDSKQKEENLQSFITKESVHDKKSVKATESGTEQLISNLDNGSSNIGNLPQIIPGYRMTDHDETVDKMSENVQETPNIDTSAGLKNTSQVEENNETFKNHKEVSCETSKLNIKPKDRIQSIPDICITPDTSDITEDDKDNVFIREADLTNNNASVAPKTHDINANPISPEGFSEGWVTIPILRGFSDSEAYTNIAMSIQELSDNEGCEESNDNSPIIQEGDELKKTKKFSVPASQTVEFEDVSEPESKILLSTNTSKPSANTHIAESSIIHLAFSRDNDLQLEENVEELSTNITILKKHANVDDTISGLKTPVILHEESLQYDQSVKGKSFSKIICKYFKILISSYF